MAEITAAPYWLEASMPSFPKIDRTLDVDVVVVGAGITGLTAAYLMKRAGRSVAVVDRREIGGYDTTATTAHVTCVTDLDLGELVRTFGRDHAQAVWDAGLAAADQIETIVRDEDIDCDWERVTGFKYAASGRDAAREAQLLRDEAVLAAELGFDADYMDEVPLVRRPGIAFAGQAKMHPRKYLARLAALIDGDGSFVFENSPCDEVTADPVGIKSGAFAVRARDIFLATHTPLMGKTNIASATMLQTKIYLYTSYVVGGKVRRGALPDGLFWDTGNPYHYIRVDKHAGHDYVIVGGEDHKTGQAADPRECFRRLEHAAAALIPWHRRDPPLVRPGDRDERRAAVHRRDGGAPVRRHRVLRQRDHVRHAGGDDGARRGARPEESLERPLRGRPDEADWRRLGLCEGERGLSVLPGQRLVVGAGREVAACAEEGRGQGAGDLRPDRGGIARRARQGDDGVAGLHAHGVHRRLERRGADVGLPLPWFAIPAERGSVERARRSAARARAAEARPIVRQSG